MLKGWRATRQPQERQQWFPRPSQVPPAGDWRVWLILAGRGWGKTRTINEWAITQAQPGTRGAIVAATAADARDIMIEGESGLLNLSHDRPFYEPSKRRLTWPNGAMATAFSADEPDRLRGPQFHWAICDELAAWRFGEQAWAMLMLGLRLGNDPRCAVATTPRPIEMIRKLVASPTTHVTRGNTYENRANLAEAFFSQIIGQYEGTRLGRQEINAEILEDVPGALWNRAMLDNLRVTQAPQLTRVVVAVDPEATATETSAETGIIVAGLGVDKHGYILDDRTLRGAPAAWASQAVAAYHSRRADRIVYETNQGGDMVAHTLQTVETNIPLKGVHASKGKQARAEPIAALYEQGKVHHVGMFKDLEDQLCEWTPNNGQASPDRLDALVWALTELMIGAQTWVRKPVGVK
jgi:phage terminase large subunit-like protein